MEIIGCYVINMHSLQTLLLDNRPKHGVIWFLDITEDWSIEISFGPIQPAQAAWVDSFRNCMKPPFHRAWLERAVLFKEEIL